MRNPHIEICGQALKHYEKISQETSTYDNIIPKAIKFYKEVYPTMAELQRIAFEISNIIKNIE